MIHEHARLTIDEARAPEFERTMGAVVHRMLAAEGCRSVELIRSVDRAGTYLLRVGWERLEDHTERWPTSEAAKELGDVLGPFLAARPDVVHYEASSVLP